MTQTNMNPLKINMIIVMLATGLFLGISIPIFPPTASAEIDFDHMLTGFPLTGPHARVDCVDCHDRGIFKGTPSECEYCHRQGGPVNATSKPLRHIPTNAPCEDCHNPAASNWSESVKVDHNSFSDTNCSLCHNGITAPGKPVNHPNTMADCLICHSQNSSWNIVNFDHSSIIGTCSSCHSKPTNHIAGSNNCDECHTAGTIWNKVTIDHASLVSPCASCHSKPVGLITSPNTCDDCHTPAGWLPVVPP